MSVTMTDGLLAFVFYLWFLIRWKSRVDYL